MVALRRPLRLPIWSWFWLLFAAGYFLLPLYSTLQFSLQTGSHSYGFALVRLDPARPRLPPQSSPLAPARPRDRAVEPRPDDPDGVRDPPLASGARPLIEFISVLPFVVPPIALTVGVIGLFQGIPWLISSTQLLALLYVIQALPFTYRALDAGMGRSTCEHCPTPRRASARTGREHSGTSFSPTFAPRYSPPRS